MTIPLLVHMFMAVPRRIAQDAHVLLVSLTTP